MKSGILIVAVLILAVIAGGVYFFWQNSSNSSAPNQATGTNGNPNPVSTEGQTSGEEAATPEAAAGNPVSLDVQISGYSFSPSTLTISVGDSVTWTNMDSAPHTVTSDSGSELDSGTLSGSSSGGYYSSSTVGGSYSHTFATAGTYAYHCGIHASMEGTIVVE